MAVFSVLFCASGGFSSNILQGMYGEEITQIKKVNKFRVDLSEIAEKSDLLNFFPNIGESLIKLSEQYNSSDAFGDEESKVRSTNNWVQKCKFLKLAMKAGNQDAENLYRESIESKKYSRDCADCLIAGYENEYDIKDVRAFFWEHLAYEDEKEKEDLAKSYLEGKLVKINKERSVFWKKYQIESFK